MSKKALVLGTGLVSRPCIEVLLRSGFVTTCVSVIQEELENLHKTFPQLSTIKLDVSKDKEMLKKLIGKSSFVISLLPSFFQHEIALICIEEQKNLISTSYVDEATKNLHQRAVDAGVTILCESGLDPGIDHMITMKCVDSLKAVGGKISEMRSLCGGIPAEENISGCMKYKFSWYPKGVFTSALQPAKCLVDDKIKEFKKVYEKPENITGIFENYNLECIPNRNALKYKDIYAIHTASSLFRGTLRYQGYSKVLQSLTSLGLMNQAPLPQLTNNASDLTWNQLLIILLGLPTCSKQEDIEKVVLLKLNSDSEQLKIITELGLISDNIVAKKDTPLDCLCAHLVEILFYEPGEQDLVLMWIRVSAQLPSGQTSTYMMSLAEKGTPVGGQSAMSKTVGWTAAACAEVVAAGSVQRKGVILPITKDIYEPVLAKLSEQGILISMTVTES